MRLALALLLALASAAAINWGYLAQHVAAGSLPALSARHPIAALRAMFGNLRWLAGFVAGMAGWVLYLSALALAPLSLVQAASAGGIGLLALLVWRTTGQALAMHERVGVLVALGGLVLLAISLGGRHDSGGHGSWKLVALWVAVSGGVALAAAVPAARLLAPGAGLGAAAGVLYAAGDVATKAAVSGGWRLAFVPVLLACHGVAFIALQLAFQRGGALATAGVATLFTNALPIAGGLVLFHDRLPGGFLAVVRIAAFAAVVFGAAALARPEGPAPELVPAS
ncbi:MAG: hypothetical protein ACR2MU_07505 [Gaiellaceae bacterium]